MKVIIDRFEGEFAVCEGEHAKMIHIEISRIPSSAKEEDVLDITNDCITIDVEATEARRKHIEELTKDLWN